MRKLFQGMMILGLALIVGLGLSVPKAFALNHFTIYVYEDIGYSSGAGGYPALTDDVTAIVFNAGSMETLETIYSDTASTAMVNPIVQSVFDDSGKIDFYTGTADTTVDIIITDNTTGSSTFLNGVTTSTRTAIINNRAMEDHVCVFYYNTSTVAGWDRIVAVDASDTEIDFPINTLVKDVFIYVIATTGTAVNLNVGLSMDPDSLLAGDWQMDNLAAAAFYYPEILASVLSTNASYKGLYGIDLVAGSYHEAESDEGAVCYLGASSTDYMVQFKRPHLTTSATTVIYSVQSADATGRGLVFIIFQMLTP